MKTKQLQQRWQEVELGDVANFLRGPFGSSVQKSVCVIKGPNTYKLYEQGNVINNDFNRGEYYISKAKFDELKKFELLPNDIAITCAGTLGKIAIVPENLEKGIINSVLMRIRIDNSKILLKFFLYFFRSPLIQNQIISQSQGVAVKNLFATSKLRSFKIPLPPLHIQKQIVSILEKAEKLKQKREDADILTKEYLQSVFYEMFGNPGTNSKKWPIKSIQEVALDKKGAIRMGPFGSQLKKHELVNEGIKVLWIENIVDNKFNPNGTKYITKEKYEQLKGFTVNEGDLIITMMGTIGRVEIVPDIGKAIISSHLLKIEINKKICNPIYLKKTIMSPFVQNQFKDASHGAIMSGLNGGIIKTTKIPLPPIELQKKFALIVEEVEKLKEKQKQSKEEIKVMFDSLMKQAFNGELVK